MGERLPCKQEVTSSTLVFSTSAISTADKSKRKAIYACIRMDFRLLLSIGRMPVSEKALPLSSTQCGSRHRAHARERKGFAFELRSAEAAIGRMPVSEKAKN